MQKRRFALERDAIGVGWRRRTWRNCLRLRWGGRAIWRDNVAWRVRWHYVGILDWLTAWRGYSGRRLGIACGVIKPHAFFG